MDVRTDVPLYTVAEAARHLGLPPSTLRYWVSTKHLVRQLPPETKGGATLPFVALAEAQFIHGMRGAGLSLQAVTEGVAALRSASVPTTSCVTGLPTTGATSSSTWAATKAANGNVRGTVRPG